MNPANVFVIGLLLLTANLSLGALLAPNRPSQRLADRLVWLWWLLVLATLHVAVWALVLSQAGAVPTFSDAFLRSAACLVFMGGRDGGFLAPWGAVAPLIALNGLLFLPMVWLQLSARRSTSGESLESNKTFEDFKSFKGSRESDVERAGAFEAVEISLTQGLPAQTTQVVQPPPLPEARRAVATTEPLPAPEPTRVENPKHEAPPEPAPIATSLPEPAPLMAAQPATPPSTPVVPPQPLPQTVTAAAEPSLPAPAPNRWNFHPPLPKVRYSRSQTTAEDELADQLKPLPPTPPPIRFEWGTER
jgi:hypothetical protein